MYFSNASPSLPTCLMYFLLTFTGSWLPRVHIVTFKFIILPFLNVTVPQCCWGEHLVLDGKGIYLHMTSSMTWEIWEQLISFLNPMMFNACYTTDNTFTGKWIIFRVIHVCFTSKTDISCLLWFRGFSFAAILIKYKRNVIDLRNVRNY